MRKIFTTIPMVLLAAAFMAQSNETSKSTSTIIVAPNGELLKKQSESEVPVRTLNGDSLDRDILPYGTLMRTEEYLMKVEEKKRTIENSK